MLGNEQRQPLEGDDARFQPLFGLDPVQAKAQRMIQDVVLCQNVGEDGSYEIPVDIHGDGSIESKPDGEIEWKSRRGEFKTSFMLNEYGDGASLSFEAPQEYSGYEIVFKWGQKNIVLPLSSKADVEGRVSGSVHIQECQYGTDHDEKPLVIKDIRPRRPRITK